MVANLKYPKVMSEQATIDAALSGRSLARFGDGELRLAVGGGCSSQRPNDKLKGEFRDILAGRGHARLLPCIPNFADCPRAEAWQNYKDDKYVMLYRAKQFGSAFITRPDNMPKIDNKNYWGEVRKFWGGRDVVLVRGDEKSLTSNFMKEARSVREVIGPRQHAYDEIDRIEHEIGRPEGPVIMCLGATATALAHRLAKKGVWALDLGHLGMFMKHAGAYMIPLEALRSRKYQQLLIDLHNSNAQWGSDGHKHAEAVIAFRDELEARSILDYGCGKGTFGEALAPDQRVHEYDPGIQGKAGFPKPVDLVVCTNAVEHVEPDKLGDVLRHLYLLAGKGVYLSLSCKPAPAKMSDGRRSWAVEHPARWWLDQFAHVGYGQHERMHYREDTDELTVWFRK